MSINTKAAARRPLTLSSIAELRRDLDALEASHRAGRLRTSGNWTPGQAFSHIATFIEFGYNGYPPNLNPPLIIKWIIRLQKKKFLLQGMPAGVRIPGIEGGTLGADRVPFEAGMARLRAAWDQLEKAPPTYPSPAFGEMPHEDVIRLNLKHSALHLSFLHPA
jgi:hypothetical protein